MTAGARIAVTGLGAVSALGGSVDETWRAVLEGRSGIALDRTSDEIGDGTPRAFPLARAVTTYASQIDTRLNRPFADSLDPFAAMALSAAMEAIDQAGLADDLVLAEGAAVILGHGFGGLEALEAAYGRFFGQGSQRVHPTTIPRAMLSAAASAVALTFQVHGPVFATSSACASAAHAIAQGAALVASGEVEVAIVGGSEAIATSGCLAGWAALRAVSPSGCRPFCVDRDGMVLGEGAGVLVLENMERAQARGAVILGEFLGAGMSSDAGHITQPSSSGQAGAMRRAVRAAHIDGRADVLVSAHGTGTPLNDITEARALGEVFGEALPSMPVIATKSALGHVIGGSAALQAVIGLRALEEGLAPPTAGFTRLDPSCQLDVVAGEPRRIDAGVLLQNAFAFGGLNVALVFGGPDLG